jgi:hypothetical protein
LQNAEKAGLTVFELARWSMGDYECRDYLRKGESRLGTFLSYQSKIFRSYIDSEVDDEESSSLRAVLLRILADHISLLSDRMRSSFQDNKDYNFVADCEELRFHEACQWILVEDYSEYVEVVIGGCVEEGPAVLKYLFQLRNAQG